jgi:diguanylate cyclase (GGDEF)-like protein
LRVGRLDDLRAGLLVALGLAVVGLIAWLDYATGPDLSLSIFYLIPVAACAWWGGFPHGILLALAGAVAWHHVDALENPTIPVAIGLWNGVVRFGTLAITSSLISRLHSGVVRERLLARTDSLTGAANARTFYEAVAAEAERACRTARPLTLAYLDLDNFKQVNDQLGHAAGDLVLIDLVRVIRPALRTSDLLARLGGDEFALLMPETNAEGAVALLTRLQPLLSQEMRRGGRPVSVSIGAVTFLRPLWDVDLMVQQVDVLMYAAKRRGKDRVEHTTIRTTEDLAAGDRLRLERRATARTLCHRSARVRKDGEAKELFATVHDLSAEGVGLRTGQPFPEGTVLVIEPLSHQAKTLLARVVWANQKEGGWLHGCQLPSRLSPEELRAWLNGQPAEVPYR